MVVGAVGSAALSPTAATATPSVRDPHNLCAPMLLRVFFVSKNRAKLL